MANSKRKRKIFYPKQTGFREHSYALPAGSGFKLCCPHCKHNFDLSTQSTKILKSKSGSKLKKLQLSSTPKRRVRRITDKKNNERRDVTLTQLVPIRRRNLASIFVSDSDESNTVSPVKSRKKKYCSWRFN